jgi:hypothetical protein
LLVTPNSLPIHHVVALMCYNIFLHDNNSVVLWISEHKDHLIKMASFHTAYLSEIATVTTLFESNMAAFFLDDSKPIQGSMIFTTPSISDVLLQRQRDMIRKCATVVYHEPLLAPELKPNATTTCCRVISNIISTVAADIQTIVLSQIPSFNMNALATFMRELGLSVSLIFVLN